MKKSTFNLIVDALAFVVLATLVGTGFLIAYKLPPGSGGGEGRLGAIYGSGLSVWGLTRHGWGDIHLILAFVLAGLIALHLVSHWQWIRAMAKVEGNPSVNMRKGVILIASVVSIVLVVLPFLLTPSRFGPGTTGSAPTVTDPEGVVSPASNGENEFLYGALTIDEVARRTGLSVQKIGEILGAKTPLKGGEKWGQLLRAEGLGMRDARSKLLQAMPPKPNATPL